MENKAEGTGFITTFTGRKFYPFKPDPDEVDIGDIAHALSNMPRFTGHTREFYSVAQHSVMVSRIVSVQHRLLALLHDASEAYLCDIATPIKYSPVFAGYRKAEKRLQGVILRRFGIDPGVPADFPMEVHDADKYMNILEGLSFMPVVGDTFWGAYEKEFAGIPRLKAWTHQRARDTFLTTFQALTAS